MDAAARQSARLGAGLIFVAAGLWASVGVAVQLVPQAAVMPPELLGMMRMVLAGPVLLLVALATGKAGSLRALRRLDRARLADFALAGALFQVCLFRAFLLIGVTLTVVLTVCLPPVIAALWERAGQRGQDWSGQASGPVRAMAAAAAGLVLCSVPGLAGGGAADLAGLGLALVAAIAFVRMSQAARDLSRNAPPALVAGAGLCLSGLILCTLAPLIMPLSLSAALQSLAAGYMPALIAYLALFPTALAYAAYCAGMARCRSAQVGLTAAMIEPALAAALAFVLLDERLGPAELAGCALMVLAMADLLRAESAPAPLRSGGHLGTLAGHRAAPVPGP